MVASLLTADAGLARHVDAVAVVEEDAGGGRRVEGEPGARLESRNSEAEVVAKTRHVVGSNPAGFFPSTFLSDCQT